MSSSYGDVGNHAEMSEGWLLDYRLGRHPGTAMWAVLQQLWRTIMISMMGCRLRTEGEAVDADELELRLCREVGHTLMLEKLSRRV